MSTAQSRQRLAAVLTMLGSEHDALALKAARWAERLRAQEGVTWEEMLAPVASFPEASHGDDAWKLIASACFRHPDRLSNWETVFLASVCRQSHVSAKQFKTLLQMVGRMGP